MVLDIGIRKGILRLSVPDVPLAVGGISETFEDKIENLLFWLLRYSAGDHHQYGGSDAWAVSRIAAVGSLSCFLRKLCAGFSEKYIYLH